MPVELGLQNIKEGKNNLKKRILALTISVLVVLAVLIVPMAVMAADNEASQSASTSTATTFLVGGTEEGTKDTAVSNITFTEDVPGATITDPSNNIDGSGDPQVLSASDSEPVVKIKNTHGTQAYDVVLEITTWTNSVVSMEYYNLAADGATDIETVTDELSNADGVAKTVSTGVSISAGTYKDLYLKLVLSSLAGKTGESTLSVLGES